MLFEQLFSNPQMFLIMVLAIVYALTIHEFSHAAAATILGDTTAKYAGRLTLNPVAHLDLWGTLMLLVAGFGWGRPVPVNPYNMRWRSHGEAAVALAGPISNLLSVVVFSIIFSTVFQPYKFILVINQAFGNQIYYNDLNLAAIFVAVLIFVNLVLGIFNFIPIPPLDGSKVLFTFLPATWDDFKAKFTVYGLWILIGLILLGRFGGFDIFGSIIDLFLGVVNRFL